MCAFLHPVCSCSSPATPGPCARTPQHAVQFIFCSLQEILVRLSSLREGGKGVRKGRSGYMLIISNYFPKRERKQQALSLGNILKGPMRHLVSSLGVNLGMPSVPVSSLLGFSPWLPAYPTPSPICGIQSCLPWGRVQSGFTNHCACLHPHLPFLLYLLRNREYAPGCVLCVLLDCDLEKWGSAITRSRLCIFCLIWFGVLMFCGQNCELRL